MLVTTHYLDEAEHCHRLAIIHAGKLAALGTASALKERFASRPIIELVSDRPVEAMEALDKMPEVEKTSLFGTAVHAGAQVRSHEPRGVAAPPLPLPASPSRRPNRVAPSLEDVFLDVVETWAR